MVNREKWVIHVTYFICLYEVEMNHLLKVPITT